MRTKENVADAIMTHTCYMIDRLIIDITIGNLMDFLHFHLQIDIILFILYLNHCGFVFGL